LKSALSIPKDEYDEIEIVDPHLIRDHPADKLGIVDVKLKTVSGKTIHIDIQIASMSFMKERLRFMMQK